MDKEDVVQILYELYYSAIKKNEIMPFAAKWRDLEIALLSEVKSHREGNSLWYCLYFESKKKKDTNEFIYKTETDSQTYDYQGGRARPRDG